jgi:hypothetical protein
VQHLPVVIAIKNRIHLMSATPASRTAIEQQVIIVFHG